MVVGTGSQELSSLLPHAFKKPTIFFKLVNFPEEQIRDGGGARMKRSWLLSACRLMTRSRKWEVWGYGFGQGSLHTLPLSSPESPGAPLCGQEGSKVRGAGPAVQSPLLVCSTARSSTFPGHPSVPRCFLNRFSVRSLFLSLSSLFRVNINKWQLSEWGSCVYPMDARQTMNLVLPRWHRLSSKQINRAGAIETGPNTQSYSDSMVITAPPVTIWTHKLIFYLDNKTSPMSPVLAMYGDAN